MILIVMVEQTLKVFMMIKTPEQHNSECKFISKLYTDLNGINC